MSGTTSSILQAILLMYCVYLLIAFISGTLFHNHLLQILKLMPEWRMQNGYLSIVYTNVLN